MDPGPQRAGAPVDAGPFTPPGPPGADDAGAEQSHTSGTKVLNVHSSAYLDHGPVITAKGPPAAELPPEGDAPAPPDDAIQLPHQEVAQTSGPPTGDTTLGEAVLNRVAFDEPALPETAPDKAAPDEVAPRDAALSAVAPNKRAPRTAARDKTARRTAAPGDVTQRAAPDKVAPRDSAPDKVAPPDSAPDKVAPPDSAPDKVTPRDAAPDKVALRDADARASGSTAPLASTPRAMKAPQPVKAGQPPSVVR